LTPAHEAADDTRVPKRFFTPDEANRALSELRPLVEEMVAHSRALDQARAGHAKAMRRIAGNGGDLTPSDLAELQEALEREAGAIGACVEQIEALGAQVKGIEAGLIDFPALRDGEEVLLCWQLGEEEITFWHTPSEGFAGRRRLPL
jgi:hypothetical protein